MNKLRPGRIRLILAAVLLLLLLGIAALLGLRARDTYVLVRIEQARTPTPEPPFGNVMLVTPDPNAPTPQPVLRTGSRGEEVTALQERLRALGYLNTEPDGQFGPATKQAVLTFQQVNGIDADGIVGTETREAVFADSALPCPTATPAPTSTPTPAPTKASLPWVRADGLPIVVNRSNPLPDDYQLLDLVNMTGYCDSSIVKIKAKGIEGERIAVDALMEMLRAAVAEGIGNWQISAGYRSVKTQTTLFNNKVQEYIDKGRKRSSAISAARQTVADPGTSEHHLGLAFDVTVPGTSFKGTKQQKWLAAHCTEYGFIIRYTEEKEKITGFTAEPWHIRYVGTEHAQRMTKENLCLEEYIQRYGSA